jgi:hypothetical protein
MDAVFASICVLVGFVAGFLACAWILDILVAAGYEVKLHKGKTRCMEKEWFEKEFKDD